MSPVRVRTARPHSETAGTATCWSHMGPVQPGKQSQTPGELQTPLPQPPEQNGMLQSVPIQPVSQLQNPALPHDPLPEQVMAGSQNMQDG